jgi:hypothetical protein
MQELTVDLNSKPIKVENTIDFIEFSRNPVKTILILRSEFALFQGSNNMALEYIERISKGTYYSSDILPEFLQKTIGEPDKVPHLFEHFNRQFVYTKKEMKYFGALFLNDDAQSKLNNYLSNPSDLTHQEFFIESLSEVIQQSEENIATEYDTMIKYMNQVVSEVLL